MSENLFLSYLNHLDIGYLFRLWQQGTPFTQHDWISVMLLLVNLVLVISLSYLLIKKHRKTTSPVPMNQYRSQESQITGPQERREPTVSDAIHLSATGI